MSFDPTAPAITGNQKADTALLVIDVQRGLFEKGTPIYRSSELIRNIQSLIARAREANAPVVFIQHSSERDLVKNSDSWQLHLEMTPLTSDHLVSKEHGDAFEGTDLGPLLESLQIRQVVITGLVTHGCVKASCLGALQRGYQVVLAQDAHSSYSQKAEELVQTWNRKLQDSGAVLQPTDAVVF